MNPANISLPRIADQSFSANHVDLPAVSHGLGVNEAVNKSVKIVISKDKTWVLADDDRSYKHAKANDLKRFPLCMEVNGMGGHAGKTKLNELFHTLDGLLRNLPKTGQKIEILVDDETRSKWLYVEHFFRGQEYRIGMGNNAYWARKLSQLGGPEAVHQSNYPAALFFARQNIAEARED